MTRLLAVLVVLVGLSGLVGCKTQAPVAALPVVEEVVAKPEVAEKPAPPAPVKEAVVPTPPAPKPAVEAPKPEPPAPKPEKAAPKPEAPAPTPVKEAPKPVAPAPAPAKEAPKAEEKPAAPAKTEEAAKPAQPKPEAPAPKPEPPKPLGDVTAKTWEIPGSADVASWAVMTWSNPGTLSAENGAIKVECQGGENDKTSVGLRLKPAADLASRTALVLDIANGNAEAVKVALAVLTKGAKYFESQPKSINPGANKAVDFGLKSKDYKTAPDWEYNASIEGLDDTSSLCLIIYGKEKGTVTISNVTLVMD